MIVASMLVAAALVVSTMPAPEHDDCEVVTNCVFDASRQDGRMFSISMELDASPSNGVEVVFGCDADGDGILSRTEEALAVGYDCGEWKMVECATGAETTCAGTPGRVTLDWKLRLDSDRIPRSLAATANGQAIFSQLCQSPPAFLFNPAWNAAKIVRRGQINPNPNVVCLVNNDPIVINIR